MEDPVLDTSPALRKAFACLRDKYGMSEDSSPLDILGRVASELGGSLRQPTGAITWASQAIPQVGGRGEGHSQSGEAALVVERSTYVRMQS